MALLTGMFAKGPPPGGPVRGLFFTYRTVGIRTGGVASARGGDGGSRKRRRNRESRPPRSRIHLVKSYHLTSTTGGSVRLTIQAPLSNCKTISPTAASGDVREKKSQRAQGIKVKGKLSETVSAAMPDLPMKLNPGQYRSATAQGRF